MDRKGQVYDPGAFNATFGGKKFIIDATGKTTDEAWKAATRGTQFAIAKVDGTTFRTDVPTGHITTDELGRSYANRSEEHTSELQVTNAHLVCRLLLEKKKNTTRT